MTFIEERFPDDISYGSSGGPEYSTDVVITASGAEHRNVNWQQARARYNVAHGVKTEEQLQELIAFFRACKGRAIGFRFKDWSDYQIPRQLLARGDGKSKEFQITKYYSSGDVTEARIITKPVLSTVQLWLNSSRYYDFRVDRTSGIICFAHPPPPEAIIEIACEFDVPVRFDTDRLAARLDAYGVNSWNDILLIEVRI
jgi:uncharacterized protein (TIGR02217 family)